MTYGEMTIGNPSQDAPEFIISSYSCHPSLANDNLSGTILWILLLQKLQTHKLHNRYRFILAPETIGVIAYLSLNRDVLENVVGGFVLTTNAGPGQIGVKHSFRNNHLIDRAVNQALLETNVEALHYPFDINGSDERQYSSPGFRIPTVTITKSKYYEYEEYHTSLDNLDFVSAKNLVTVLDIYLKTVEILETAQTFKSLAPHGEPQLGKRGLYPTTGGTIHQPAADSSMPHRRRTYQSNSDGVTGSLLDALRWILFYSDGSNSILDIAEKTNISMTTLNTAANMLLEAQLLVPTNKKRMESP